MTSHIYITHHYTVMRARKFTKDQDEKIMAYYNTPEDQRPSRTEFAKSINHSSRFIKERYEKYLSCREFTEEECDQLVQYVKQYNLRWATISKLFNGKFSSLVLRDKYNSLMKKKEKEKEIEIALGNQTQKHYILILII